MLTSLKLTGYRRFESYRLDGLTRVNLLVGRNNCGKTSILEAVDLVVAQGDPSVLRNAATRRRMPRRDEASTASTKYPVN